ncbi:two-component regulator propeller domain-containing protein [Tellurirhabdus rosea]|uniref:two-component regulator propeller domain-containing protein n=1 Tax=Tellurirhabdus rosea TaxID=2674997 RepID=UPI0022587ECF|nr:sensor histidine kinase [Tellurirhabdus rosea]
MSPVRLLLVLLLSGLCLTVPGQTLPFEFRHIQEAQGLSHKLIYTLFRDRDGFLWVGTNSGLNRFDGSRFSVFKHHPRQPETLASNIVHAVCQTPDGSIWVGTSEGISRLDPQLGRFQNFRRVNGQKLNACYNLLADRHGHLWFCSSRLGLYRYDPATQRFFHYLHQPRNTYSLSSNSISKNSLLEDRARNGLWIATAAGVNFLDFATGRFRNFRTETRQTALFSAHEITALALSGDALYFADNSAGHIVQYDLGRQRVACTLVPPDRPRRPAFPVATLFVDRARNLWMSTWNHTLFWSRANSGRFTEFAHDPAERTSIAANFFWTAWQQEDGTIWLGTINGLSYTNPDRAFYRVHNLGRQRPSLRDDRGLNGFLEDDDGSWWLSSATNELLHYQPLSGRLTSLRIPSPAPSEEGFGRPLLVFSPDKSQLYVLLSYSLLVFDKRSARFRPFPEAARIGRRLGEVSNLLAAGDSLWIFGRRKNRAVCYRPRTGAWREYAIPPQPGPQDRFFVRQAAFDRRGTLWLDVFPGGFAFFSEKEQRFVAVPPGEASVYEEYLFHFKPDSLNQFWLPAAGQGVIRYQPEQNAYKIWTEFDGLGSTECKAVCPDASGRIWVAAMNKFAVISPERPPGRAASPLRRLPAFSTGGGPLYNFELPLNDAEAEYENYMFPLRNGHILTTMQSYLIEFMPERFSGKWSSAQILISRVDLPDTTLLVRAGQPGIELGTTDNNFSISYAVLNQPQQTYSYAYKLEGYDEKWVSAGSRTVANYTKLPGGRYTFLVRATSGSGFVKPARLAITVATPFYATGWFRAGLLLLLGGLAYGFYRYRTRETARMHHLQMQATRLERDKTDIQYKNLINHLNPHFLFNSLTSLNSLIRTEPRQASVFLQKLSTIYRYILQSRNKETVPLEHELAFVRQYTDLQQSRFEDALRVLIDVPAACRQRSIVPVTLQNLFENAIKHNTLEDDSPLTIRVYVEDDYLLVENNLQRKLFVETSNQQGLESLQTLYRYLSDRPLTVQFDEHRFLVKVPLL